MACYGDTSSNVTNSLAPTLFKETSSNLSLILNSSSVTQGKSGSLGERIQQFNSMYVCLNWEKAYGMRSKRWREDVSFSIWQKEIIKLPYKIEEINVLSATAFPSGSAPASAFELIKVAQIRDIKSSVVSYKFYTEIWAIEDNEWVVLGGALWDGTKPPWLSISTNP